MDTLKFFNESYYSKHGWTTAMIVEIFIDLSRIVNIDFKERVTADGNKIDPSIFGGIPKHSNFFYLIVIICKQMIPKWFFEKYVDNEDERERWIDHIYYRPLLR